MEFLDYIFGSSEQDRFAKQLVRRIKSSGETREVRYQKDPFQLGFYEQGELTGIANLGNLFSEYERLPRGDRDAYLSRITRTILAHHKSIPELFEDAQPDILPIVRSRAYLEIEHLQHRLTGESAPSIPHVEVAGHLLAMPVYDLPEAVISIGEDSYRGWNLSLYQLMETALDNLEQLEFLVSAYEDHLFVFRNQDNYDASRLLLVEQIADLPVSGRPVAMVPTRDCLMVTGDEDEIGLMAMIDIAQQYRDSPRPVSMLPCLLLEEKWHAWMPPRGNPLFPALQELCLHSLAGEYREQREAIEATFAKSQRSGFVANYYMIQDNQTQELTSYCVWPECPYALLPQTDVIIFMDQHHMKPLASGTWEKVSAVLGSKLEDLETYPPRFRVLSFPNETELEQIGELSPFSL